MRFRIVLPLVAALGLAACGSSDDGEPMSDDAVADAMADAEMPEPGMYSTKQELLEFDFPGMTDDMAAMMRSAFEQGAAEENTYCLTPEDAANAHEDMLKGMAEADCNITRMDMAGGTIDAAMSCPNGEGVTGDVTMTGSMDSDGADIVMSFSTELPGLGQGSMRMRVQSERIGDCS